MFPIHTNRFTVPRVRECAHNGAQSFPWPVAVVIIIILPMLTQVEVTLLFGK